MRYLTSKKGWGIFVLTGGRRRGMIFTLGTPVKGQMTEKNPIAR